MFFLLFPFSFLSFCSFFSCFFHLIFSSLFAFSEILDFPLYINPPSTHFRPIPSSPVSSSEIVGLISQFPISLMQHEKRMEKETFHDEGTR
jgi:hypothetical protein